LSLEHWVGPGNGACSLACPTTGKSLRLIGNRFRLRQAPSRKIISFRFSEFHDCMRHPASAGGAYRDRHGRGKRDAVDARRLSALCAWTKAYLADGQAVWSCPPDAGVKSCGTFRKATVANKPGTPGRARSKPLKPLRRECRCSGGTCRCLRAQCALSFAR